MKSDTQTGYIPKATPVEQSPRQASAFPWQLWLALGAGAVTILVAAAIHYL